MAVNLIFLVSLLNTFILISKGNSPNSKDEESITISMPNVAPQIDDHYLCHSLKLDNQKSMYAVSFSPVSKHGQAHHILLYLCDEPGAKAASWNCGEMTSKNVDIESKPVCKGLQQKIIYAWAMDAPGLVLPDDVSFQLGGQENLDHLILQVHYKDATEFRKNKSFTDDSGINISFLKKPTSKFAGVYLLATDGIIPPQSTVYLEAACQYTGISPLHPFAYRTHTHSLGELVVGYRVRYNEQWLELGRKSPQKPQMFYNVTYKGFHSVIQPGDYIAARCIMTNTYAEKTVEIGATRADEMCNFYLMYWVYAKNRRQLYDPDNQICASPGFPTYSWRDEGLDLATLPSDANVVPGTTDHITETIYNEAGYIEKALKGY